MQENALFSSISFPMFKKKNKVKKFMLSFFCWICTLIIWVLIGMIIYIFIPVKMDSESFYEQYQLYNIKQKLKSIVITAIIIFYIVYIILEFFSPIVIYLKQDDEESLKKLMKNLFEAKPSFIFNYNLDESMNEEFEYEYYRDISGSFELNITKEQLKSKKVYIMLEINYEIKFADITTQKDYNIKRKKFKDKIIKEKGNIKSIKEVRELKDVKKYYKVKTTKNDCCFIDFCLYIIFTILTFSELYKLYINSKIIYEKFFIIKIVSTNTNLKNSELYNSFNPELKIGDKVLISRNDFYNNIEGNKNKLGKSDKTNSLDTNINTSERSESNPAMPPLPQVNE